MNRTKISAALVFTLMFAAGACMAAGETPAPLSPADRADVVAKLSAALKEKYVFPDVADSVAKQIEAKSSKGGYASAEKKADAKADSEAFAETLSHDLRDFGKDAHFRVDYRPDFQPHEDDETPPTAEEVEQERAEMVKLGYGLARVEHLPGNVGYLDLRFFGDTEFVGAAYTSAMSLLAGTDAMIIDLRRNGGGDPSSVAFFVSHFFASGDERHLNDLYFSPKNVTREFWTNPAVGSHYTKPVYVLTSARTFSGAEECAYDFQTQKRATLVGEVTGGGANPGGPVAIGHGLVAFIPSGRAINPITHTNWEHVGVKPDVAVPAQQAFFNAYAAILHTLLPKATDPRQRTAIEKAIASAEKGEAEQVDYSRMK